MMEQDFDLLSEMRRQSAALASTENKRPSVFLPKSMEPFLRNRGMQPTQEGEYLFWGIAPSYFGYAAGAKLYTFV